MQFYHKTDVRTEIDNHMIIDMVFSSFGVSASQYTQSTDNVCDKQITSSEKTIVLDKIKYQLREILADRNLSNNYCTKLNVELNQLVQALYYFFGDELFTPGMIKKIRAYA